MMTIHSMKKSYCGLMGAVVLFFCCSTSYGQREILDSLVTGFKAYRGNAYQEKLYVHLHRTSLLTGEMLWFKVYGVDGAFHKSSDLSKVAYIEIIDKNNRPVLQSKIQLTRTGGNGSVYLPATILTGNYTFRAYTNWMKNFDPEFYFHTQVTIINPFVKPDNLVATSSSAFPPVRAEFFPEGGNLIAGIANRVAFKVSAAGSPVSGALFLVGPSGDTLSRGAVNRFGLGRFTFTPSQGVAYKALFVDSAKRSSWHNVPAAQSSGFALMSRRLRRMLRD
jgi:hypothetical protein